MPEILTAEHGKEGGHFYRQDGTPAYTYINKKGEEKPTTLREARKETPHLVPGTTTITGLSPKPGLRNWIIDQTILSCLTLPKIEGESEVDYIKRIKDDSKAQSLKAAETGTRIHAYIQQGFCGESLDEDGMRYYTSAQKCLLEAVGTIKWQIESSFATDKYGGKCDLHSEDYVIDFKSTEKDLANIQTWDEHDLQLAAYREGLKIPQAKCAILYISVKTAESKLIWIPEDKLQRGWLKFTHLLNYWYSDKGL
jgi:hypothetical protein